MRKYLCSVAMLMPLILATASVRGEFQLSSDDRVVIVGDTALVQGNTLEFFHQFLRTRYPDRCPFVCNLGKSRCTPEQAKKRVEREIMPLEPTRVMLCFGLEGGSKEAFNQAKQDASIADLRELALMIKERGIKVEFLTPPPPDEGRFRGLKRMKYRTTVENYSDAVRKLASELDAPVADWNAAAAEYRKNYQGKVTPGWTRNGIIPSWYSFAVLADVLLAHWQAEPLDYLITLNWAEGGEASATMGKARVADRSSKKIMLGLEGVPVVVNMLGGQKMPDDNWPLSKWFRYRLKIENAPRAGLVISQDGENKQSFTDKQLAEGVDISTSGPLAYHAATKKLHNAILSGCNQFSRYFMASEDKAPEPELEEGFKLLHEAQKALVIGAHRVACRTPARFDVTLTVEETFESIRNDSKKEQNKPNRPTRRPPGRPNRQK